MISLIVALTLINFTCFQDSRAYPRSDLSLSVSLPSIEKPNRIRQSLPSTLDSDSVYFPFGRSNYEKALDVASHDPAIPLPKVKKKKKKPKPGLTGSRNQVSDDTRAKQKKAKRVKSEGALKDVNPVNKDECKRIFMEKIDSNSGNSPNNPQFVYAKQSKAVMALQKYSDPSTKYLKQAQRVLDLVIGKYGSESNYHQVVFGNVMSKEEVCRFIEDYLQSNDLSGVIQLQFSEHFIAPTSMSGNRMNIALPCRYRTNSIRGVCDHEIGTHFFRRINDHKQPWYKHRKDFGLQPFTTTEEGLACLNQLLHYREPYLYQAALHYYCCVRAASLSFADLYRELETYIDDPDRRWRQCLRVKRGMGDTGVPGTFSKDQAYFEGALNLLKQRRTLDFRLLYVGKLSLEDLDTVGLNYGIFSDLRLPQFLNDVDDYFARLDRIATINGLHDL